MMDQRPKKVVDNGKTLVPVQGAFDKLVTTLGNIFSLVLVLKNEYSAS